MISLQSTLAYSLDQQGVLPEKFADLALRPKNYEWYQKYAITQSSSDIIRFDLFGAQKWSSDIKKKVRELVSGSEFVFQTKLIGLPATKKSGNYQLGVNLHDSTDYDGNSCRPYIFASRTATTSGDYSHGMGYESATRSYAETDSLYMKMICIQSTKKATSYVSTDGSNWTSVQTRGYGSYSYGPWEFYIYVPSIENISFPDTKFIVNGITYFDGKNSQRIS